MVRIWADTAPAAVRAAGTADPQGCITTQGHVLRVADFLATLTTEAVLHHLDDAVRPADWDDLTYLLKATGREPLTDRDRVALGEAAGWFPLLG